MVVTLYPLGFCQAQEYVISKAQERKDPLVFHLSFIYPMSTLSLWKLSSHLFFILIPPPFFHAVLSILFLHFQIHVFLSFFHNNNNIIIVHGSRSVGFYNYSHSLLITQFIDCGNVMQMKMSRSETAKPTAHALRYR